LKQSVRKLFERLRGTRSQGPPSRLPAEPPQTDSLPHFSTELQHKSGLTVFDDRALRFRSLTLANGIEETIEDPGALQGAFKIRVAKREGFRREASTLVDRRYTDRGYQTKAAEPDPHLFTFVAYDEGELVGTVSIRIDSDKGLSADELYKDELDVLRDGGCKLCEFTRLAVDVVNVSKPVLAGLFHTAYLYAGEVHACTFCVIEVNPRHVPFYRRALKFEPIGPERTNLRVNAPAVLLCASFDAIAEGLKKYGGQHEAATGERSLFPWGFSPKEEQGILDRLKALEAQGTGQARPAGETGGPR
jgi:hypothetical protein